MSFKDKWTGDTVSIFARVPLCIINSNIAACTTYFVCNTWTVKGEHIVNLPSVFLAHFSTAATFFTTLEAEKNIHGSEFLEGSEWIQ